MNVWKPIAPVGDHRLGDLLGRPGPEGLVALDAASGVRLCSSIARRTRSASASVERIVILQPTVRSIAAGSRPTSAQCARRISSLWATISGVPKTFHMSACWATMRSVFRSPPPPIMIGRCGWTGGGLIRRWSNA